MPTTPKTKERIIQERLHEVMAHSGKDRPIEYATILVVRKGELVPEEFRGLPNIKTDAHGVSQGDWEDAWCQSHWDKAPAWDNGWGECWDNTGPSSLPSGIFETRVNIRRVTLHDFSAAERATLARYGIIK